MSVLINGTTSLANFASGGSTLSRASSLSRYVARKSASFRARFLTTGNSLSCISLSSTIRRRRQRGQRQRCKSSGESIHSDYSAASDVNDVNSRNDALLGGTRALTAIDCQLPSVNTSSDGRNLLNKKGEQPPSTIKESSESSQTMDEQDGGSGGAASGAMPGRINADKGGGHLKHENTVVRVDTATLKAAGAATTGPQQKSQQQQLLPLLSAGKAYGCDLFLATVAKTTRAAALPPPSPTSSVRSQKQEIVRLTQQLLDAVSIKDFASYTQLYRRLCDPSMTCFEPETVGNLIEGLDFHKFYFEQAQLPSSSNVATAGRGVAGRTRLPPYCQVHTTLLNPNVHLIGEDGACIAYVHLTQFVDKFGENHTRQAQETRVWQKRAGRGWVCIHVHRSGDPSASVSMAAAAVGAAVAAYGNGDERIFR